MTLFPGERFVLRSNLSPDEIRQRLRETVAERRRSSEVFKKDTRTKPYEGRLEPNGFEICRIINYRNSFLPQISGVITAIGSVTEIAVRMRPLPAVQVFMAIWMGIIALVCIGVLTAQIGTWHEHNFEPAMLLPFIMLGFGFLISHLAFRGESRNSKAFLMNLFEAYETSE